MHHSVTPETAFTGHFISKPGNLFWKPCNSPEHFLSHHNGSRRPSKIPNLWIVSKVKKKVFLSKRCSVLCCVLLPKANSDLMPLPGQNMLKPNIFYLPYRSYWQWIAVPLFGVSSGQNQLQFVPVASSHYYRAFIWYDAEGQIGAVICMHSRSDASSRRCHTGQCRCQHMLPPSKHRHHCCNLPLTSCWTLTGSPGSAFEPGAYLKSVYILSLLCAAFIFCRSFLTGRRGCESMWYLENCIKVISLFHWHEREWQNKAAGSEGSAACESGETNKPQVFTNSCLSTAWNILRNGTTNLQHAEDPCLLQT